MREIFFFWFLFFFDEGGFQIISKRHSEFYRDRIKEREIHIEGEFQCKSDLTIADVLKVDAGDILIFHPDLLHRGYSSAERASFHLALFESKDSSVITRDAVSPKNILYRRVKPLPNSMIKSQSNLRKIINLIKYYSPLPSRNFYKLLFRRPSYIKNNFIQRGSFFQK